MENNQGLQKNEGITISDLIIISRIENEEFIDLITHKLSCIYITNSIKNKAYTITEASNELFSDILSLQDIYDLFEEYIKNKDISNLEEIYLLLLKNYKINKKCANGNMNKIIGVLAGNTKERIGVLKYLNEKKLDNNKIGNDIENVKTEVKNMLTSDTNIETVNKDSPIILSKGNIDYDYWDNIFNRLINSLDLIFKTKGFRATLEMREFAESLIPENRGLDNVFLNPEDFINRFKLNYFYDYLLSYLKDGRKKYRQVLADVILENFPIFEAKKCNITHFLEKQGQLMEIVIVLHEKDEI